MKSGDFAKLLRAAGELIGSASLSEAAQAFEMRPTATMATVAKAIGTDPSATLWSDPASLSRALTRIRPLVAAVGKPAAKDVDALIALCARGPKAGPAPRVARGRKSAGAPGIVDEYVRDLEAALGKQSAFSEVYARLSSDVSLGVADYKAIAKAFARVASKSKADALKRIAARHQSVLGFDAKARATGGRSAA